MFTYFTNWECTLNCETVIHVTASFGYFERIISSSTLWILMLKSGRIFFCSKVVKQCTLYVRKIYRIWVIFWGQPSLDFWSHIWWYRDADNRKDLWLISMSQRGFRPGVLPNKLGGGVRPASQKTLNAPKSEIFPTLFILYSPCIKRSNPGSFDHDNCLSILPPWRR